jgi:hypothetical protein
MDSASTDELVAATLAAGLLASTPAAAQRLRSERAEPVSEHRARAEYAELHFDCLKALQAAGLYAGLAATDRSSRGAEKSGFWKPRLPIPVCQAPDWKAAHPPVSPSSGVVAASPLHAAA